ncbi:MAG: UbiD family decarboxylase [Desulfovibrio sp.]|nr:UbiD family decarboxylase [Desulfovibrio sp.]
MGYSSLQTCVADLLATGRLRVIDAPLDPDQEIPAVQRRAFVVGAPALLFANPKGCSFPLLANLFGTRERVNYIFRDALDNLKFLFQAKSEPAKIFGSPLKFLKSMLGARHLLPREEGAWETRGSVPALERVCAKSDLPRLVSWPKDGGGFATLPLVYSENSRGKGNLGMYRVQLDGNEYEADEAGLHYQIHRGIGAHHAEALAIGQRLPVHICVGGPPALSVAAVMPLPENISEILFAGYLAGGGVRIARKPRFNLPVFADCDFTIVGSIGTKTKPEGPFGDHLGYYSLKHDFPVLKIDKIFHRKDAIWPFTTVGRPPQEDTVFGDLIHELTAPLVNQVFAGIREVRAVDATGVHPLLLAIGEERYAPYEKKPKPRELLTSAFHLLGTTQTSLAKYLLIAGRAAGLTVSDIPGFFRHILERTNFSTDLRSITGATCDTLDYSGSALNEGSKLIWACQFEKLRELGREIKDLPSLPAGYGNPRVVAPGVLAIGAPTHAAPRGKQDEEIEKDLLVRLEKWRERDSFPLVVAVDDPDFCARSFDNFLWVTFTRSDPAVDVYGVRSRTDAKRWLCEAPLLIDARMKGHFAPILEEDPQVAKKVESLAKAGAPLAGLF